MTEVEAAIETEPQDSGRSTEDGTRDSYYGVPPIHKAHWEWLITTYYFLGGIAGASYAVAGIARLVGGEENKEITRAGQYISLAALLPSPVLLILDLGRPERFYRMLRIFKLRSPMSVGSWLLAAFGGFSFLSAAIQAAEDGLLGRENPPVGLLRALPARLIGTLGIPLGFGVSGYTGVLVSATAVPLWTKNALMMGPLFVTSSISNATAAIALALSTSKNTRTGAFERLERLDSVVLLTELGMLEAHRRRLGPIIARPLVEGRTGGLYRYGVLGLGILAPLLLQGKSVALGKQPSRPLVALASLLVLGGGYTFRYVINQAGRLSADDPASTFELARSEGSNHE